MDPIIDQGRQILDNAVALLQDRATNVGQEAQKILRESAEDIAALGVEFAEGKLDVNALARYTRKVGVTVESKLARIARAEARQYVRDVLKLITGGASDLLGALGIKLPV